MEKPEKKISVNSISNKLKTKKNQGGDLLEKHLPSFEIQFRVKRKSMAQRCLERSEINVKYLRNGGGFSSVLRYFVFLDFLPHTVIM
jgi:hypothetical protein